MPGSPISPSTGSESTTSISTAASAGPRRSPSAEVLASREGEAALAEAEERLLAEANALGQAKLARLSGHKASRPTWRAIGLDAEGLDLAAGGPRGPRPIRSAGARPRGMAGASQTASRGWLAPGRAALLRPKRQ